MNAEDSFQTDPSQDLAARIAHLISGYIRKDLTDSEHRELDNWVTENMKNQQLFEELTDPANIKKWITWKKELDSDAALDRIRTRLGVEKSAPAFPKHRSRLFWPAAAAV